MKDKLEILVVEDDEKHLADAKTLFEPLCENGLFRIEYVATYKDTLAKLGDEAYDGVISDVFFPSGLPKKDTDKLNGSLYRKLGKGFDISRPSSFEYIDIMAKWRGGESQAPLGVCVAQYCRDKKIPVVLNTDIYHHNVACEPVSMWTRTFKDPSIDLVDNKSPFGEERPEGGKQWEHALRKLFERIYNQNQKEMNKIFDSNIEAGGLWRENSNLRYLAERDKKPAYELGLKFQEHFGLDKL